MAKRLTKAVGEYWRTFSSEDGVNYRGEHQEMDPVLAHVKYLDDKVNQAPKPGNKNDWRYLGSIPETILHDWCRMTGIGVDAWARDQFGEKREFIRYLQANFPVFLAPKKKPSQILVP